MKKSLFSVLAFVVVLFSASMARAEQPACTGDRHYDGVGCCPVVTTTTTLPPVSCESDQDCQGELVCVDGICVSDPGCPDPAPCPDVTCGNCDPTLVCNVDVCKDGKCANGSAGSDGEGACAAAQDCPVVVNNNNTTVTVNRCPDQESLVPCRRLKNGRLRCPRNKTPKRVLMPYSKAKASQKPGAKNPLPDLP